jgi:hypothetical protein
MTDDDLRSRFAAAAVAVASAKGLRGDLGGVEIGRRLGLEGVVAQALGCVDSPALRNARLTRRYHERVLQEVAADVSRQLAADGVPHFFARGVVLAGSLYAPGEREFMDIDLWIRPRDAAASRQSLALLGFEELPSAELSGPPALSWGTTLRRAGGALEEVDLDLHWGLESVSSLLPRGVPLPEAIWGGIGGEAGVPAPDTAWHAALMVHHLVHHDFLHVRALLDLALLRTRCAGADAARYFAACTALGVGRVADVLDEVLRRDLDLAVPPRTSSRGAGWRERKLADLLVLDHWLGWAYEASDHEHRAITTARIRRRLLAVERLVDTRHIARDLVWPHRAFLTWRWPAERTARAARVRHWRSVLGKALG